jgi:hypothetical protein
MKRHTTLSVLAAIAFGVAMAAASSASHARQAGQFGYDPIRQCERTYYACMSLCRVPGTPPSELARCQHECRVADDRCMADIGYARAGARISQQPQLTAQSRTP